MEEESGASFALEFDFKGNSQICVVDYDTDWIDVFAMVKCFLELEDMEVKYIDDENDEVNLNSEDEYSLAKQLARKNGNVLKFKVNRKLNQLYSCRQNEIKVPSANTHSGSRYDSVTGCALPGLGERPRPGSRNKLATISISRDTLDDMKKPPDQFVDNIVQDILQGLDGSVVLEEDVEEFKVTQRKIRQGIKDKNHSSNIEWSPSCTRVPKKPLAPNEEFVNKVVRGVLSGLNGAELRSALESENTRKRAEGVIHKGVVCDSCSQDIVGIRYKCVHCPDFDLCSKCESLGSVHNENHVFLKINKAAVTGLGQRFDGQPMPLLDIPIYPTDDEGVALWEQRKLKYAKKIAHKVAKAEMKFLRWEEKRKRKEMALSPQVSSPTKRERLETTVKTSQQEESSQMTGSELTKDKLLKDWTLEFNALLLGDVNFPSGTHLQPGTKFTKSWRVLNGGDLPFDEHTYLKFLWGNIPNVSVDPVPVAPLLPGQEGAVSVECEAPRYPGTYQSTWRLVHNGCQFGQRFSCTIVVDKAEILEPREEKPVSIEREMMITHFTERAMEASEAVANLQPDQSDSSSPNKIISTNTELLTAQDILSFEMLKISKKGQEEEDGEEDEVEIEVEGLQTPNNTPCGLTPCMSPVPQLDAESLNNKMSDHNKVKETLSEARIEEVEEQSPSSTHSHLTSNEDPDMVIVNPETGDNTSIDSMDEDLLEDFCVVPLPDCFDLDKPLEECVLSTSVAQLSEEEETTNEDTIPSEEQLGFIPDVDQLLATSHTLIQTPLVPLMAATPIQPQVEMVPHIIMASPGTYSAPEIVLDVVNISEDNMKCGFVVSPDQDALPLAEKTKIDEAIPEELVPLEDEADDNSNDAGGALPSDENGNSVEAESPTPELPEASGYRETDVDAAEVFHDAEDHAKSEGESDVIVPKEGGAEIPRGDDNQYDGEDDDEDEDGTSYQGSFQQPPPPGEDQASVILGITAARAAQVASSVMKQAYDVANSAVAFLTPPSPPSANYQQSHSNPMEALIEMGFANRDRNAELLSKYKNDVNQCVQELLAEDVENWHLSRH